MNLLEFSLNNFRNYQHETFSFHPRFNVILGRNAQGKTNLLEGIFYLSLLQSFRTSASREMIGPLAPSSSLLAAVGTKECQNEIRVELEERRRHVEVNGKKANLFRDYYGLLPVLLFEPKDVYLFRTSPSVRRRYLARALFLEAPMAAKIHRDYEELVMQKNRFLKESNPSLCGDQLDVWNERIAEIGSSLIARRLVWISAINSLLPEEHRGVAGQKGTLKLDYISSFLPRDLLHDGEPVEKEIKVLFGEALEQRKEEEIRHRESLVGPHRDDWICRLNERSVGTHGSQGENRSAVIALKSAQIHLFEKGHGVPPVFLLDDVASELDEFRTKALFAYLSSTRGQVFLTTTEETPLYHPFEKAGRSFLIEEGKGRMLG